MRFKTIATTLVLISLACGLASAGDSPDEKRQKNRKMADQTLNDLYKIEPKAKAEIEGAAGYAVFNNMGTNILLLSTARGAGIAVNNKSKQETFMSRVSTGGYEMNV